MRQHPTTGSPHATFNAGNYIAPFPQPKASVPQEVSAFMDKLVEQSMRERPTLTAYPGYDGGGIQHFYKAADGWRDTLTNARWTA
jgi:hypothetical protein